jgi:hypothetical protein
MLSLFLALLCALAMGHPVVSMKDLPPPLSQTQFFEYFANKGRRSFTSVYVIPDHTISLNYATEYGMTGDWEVTEEDLKMVGSYALDILSRNLTAEMWNRDKSILVIHVMNDAETARLRAVK